MEDIGLGLRLLRSPSRDRECKAEGWLRIRASKPLVAAAIRISAAIRMGHVRVAGVCVMSTRVRYGTWRKTKSKRHAERDPGFGHHDEFLLKSAVIPETFRQEAVA
jgi:hypothetical protein